MTKELDTWKTGQPFCTRGKQREWCREISLARQTTVISQVGRRHAAAWRSGATPAAAKYLTAPDSQGKLMTDETFQAAARRKFGLSPLPPTVKTASQCQNRKADGQKCNAPLGELCHHGDACEAGGGSLRRHDSLRDTIAKHIATNLPATVHTEQRIPSLDKQTDKGTQEARLDIVVSHEGATYLVDVTVCNTASPDPSYEGACARRDGHAALVREDKKRIRYNSQQLVPLVFEVGGRIGPTGLAWLRRIYAQAPHSLQELLHTVSVQLQSHTASMAIASSRG